MPYGVPNDRNTLGWLDVGVYLAELRRTTGRGWCVVLATTGELTPERKILLSVCEYRAGAPVVRDDLALVAAHWPNVTNRDLAGAVYGMLYQFDRRLEERERAAAAQMSF